jgi:Ca2+/Na+ antiporter
MVFMLFLFTFKENKMNKSFGMFLLYCVCIIFVFLMLISLEDKKRDLQAQEIAKYDNHYSMKSGQFIEWIPNQNLEAWKQEHEYAHIDALSFVLSNNIYMIYIVYHW